MGTNNSRSINVKLGRQIIALILVLFVTLVVWTVPSLFIIAAITNTASLLVALLVLYVIGFPLYMWALILFLRKVNAMPQGHYARIFSLTGVAVLCVLLPFVMLHSLYGFTFPLTGDAYRYDTCAMQFGAGQDVNGSFSCIDSHSHILKP